MLERRARREGIRLIGAAVAKIASDAVALPVPLAPPAIPRRKDDPASAVAVVPKVVSTPT